MTITDKDREAAARCACARDREEVAAAIAQAREEGRREERKACVQDCLNMAVDGGTSEGDAGYNRMENIGVSTCCAAPVRIECAHMDDAERASRWYVCDKCGKPCEVKR